MPLLRIPYTDPLPLPKIIPATANTASGAIAALVDFLAPSLLHTHKHSSTATTSPPPSLSPSSSIPNNAARLTSTLAPPAASADETAARLHPNQTLLLTGAGISVASGLADYRGPHGTYTLNKGYRPIYYNEFCESHEARKRYWARSFLGWANLRKAKPNHAHKAVGRLGELGVVGSCITQNVDSFHPTTHPMLPTIELHGYLRALVCLTCRSEYPRSTFQSDLASLNPAWSTFLAEMLATGALDTENPDERRRRGLKTNPDGDAEIPGEPYTTFRYPACPVCLKNPPRNPDGTFVRVKTDNEGAWDVSSTGGILKPAVIMFGESIPHETKLAAEQAVDTAGRILVIGSSLATYSAWRLVKRARERGMPIGILNTGGVRGEDAFFDSVPEYNTGREAVRCSENAEKALPQVVKILEQMRNQKSMNSN